MADTLIGRELGRYQIVERLGKGAMAEVYKAYQPSLDRHIALKILHGFLAEDEEFLRRFRRGAKLAAQLRHPNIVQVYDLGVVDGVYHYLAMEYVAGETLADRLGDPVRPSEPLPLPEALRVTKDVASALSYAHGVGMVHRDVKPSNVMLDQDERAVLTDFGVAKLLGGARFTGTGALVGTPHYISPEQAMGKVEDVRSDIYSLGGVFFQLVTGHLPYEGEAAGAILLRHLSDPVPVASEINPSLPASVDRVILKAMAKDLEDRYQTADELIADLERIGAEGFSADEVETSLREPMTAPSMRGARPVPERPAPTPASMNALDGTEYLEPYVLTTDQVVTDPTELPAACEAHWDRAVDHFVTGYITSWLRDGVKRLRAAHYHGAADDLERVAIRSEAIIQRVKEDDLVRNAGLEEFLESLGAAPPVLKVDPEEIVLEPVGVGKSGESVELTITNEGRGYLFGSIACRVPWLKADPEWFGCFSGESCQVTIRTDLGGLPAGRVRSEDAIRILSVGGDRSLSVEANIRAADLEVGTSLLDFGTVGQGETTEIAFAVRNVGHGRLVCRVRARVPWVSVTPSRFVVSADEKVDVTACIHSESLPAGETSQEWALVVESNGGEAVLGIRGEVLKPELRVKPPRLDLGVVDLVDGEEESAELDLENVGPGVLNGALVSLADWLSVEPATFRCRSGESQTVRVRVRERRLGRRIGLLRVASNAGTTEVPVQLRVELSSRPEMVFVPSGVFLRGSEEDDPMAEASEKPQREIYLSDYWIGKYPVTNAQYGVFVRAAGRRPPRHWEGETPPQGEENHPVVGVSWWDAYAYCQWLSDLTGRLYRLPTEAQWEKAARGTDGRRYPWGDRWRRGRCNSRELYNEGTTEVGAFSPAGDSVYGCADMAGGVLEWVADWYRDDYYERSSVTRDPYGPASGAVKTLRGGSWTTDRWGVRCASRYNGNRKSASSEAGFRCAIWLLEEDEEPSG